MADPKPKPLETLEKEVRGKLPVSIQILDALGEVQEQKDQDVTREELLKALVLIRSEFKDETAFVKEVEEKIKSILGIMNN